MSTISKKLSRGWSNDQIRGIRIRPSEAQAKAKEDDKAMREGAEMLHAATLTIRRLLSSDRTFGDNEAALKILAILEK